MINLILRKINSNKELMNSLKKIYEEEKETGKLFPKKEKMGHVNKYLKASYSSGDSLFLFTTIITSIGFIDSLIENDFKGFSCILLMDIIAISYFLFGAYLKNKINGNSIKDLLLSFVDKNKIKQRFNSFLNLKNSFNRKRYESYDYELSLRTLEEISKYTSREEMDIILESNLDYQSIHIYNEDYSYFCNSIVDKNLNGYIESLLTKKSMKNELLSNLYDNKK